MFTFDPNFRQTLDSTAAAVEPASRAVAPPPKAPADVGATHDRLPAFGPLSDAVWGSGGESNVGPSLTLQVGDFSRSATPEPEDATGHTQPHGLGDSTAKSRAALEALSKHPMGYHSVATQRSIDLLTPQSNPPSVSHSLSTDAIKLSMQGRGSSHTSPVIIDPKAGVPLVPVTSDSAMTLEDMLIAQEPAGIVASAPYTAIMAWRNAAQNQQPGGGGSDALLQALSPPLLNASATAAHPPTPTTTNAVPRDATDNMFLGQVPMFMTSECLTFALDFLLSSHGAVKRAVVRSDHGSGHAPYALLTLRSAEQQRFLQLDRRAYLGRRCVFFARRAEDVPIFQRIVARLLGIDAERPSARRDYQFARSCLVASSAKLQQSPNSPSGTPKSAGATTPSAQPPPPAYQFPLQSTMVSPTVARVNTTPNPTYFSPPQPNVQRHPYAPAVAPANPPQATPSFQQAVHHHHHHHHHHQPGGSMVQHPAGQLQIPAAAVTSPLNAAVYFQPPHAYLQQNQHPPQQLPHISLVSPLPAQQPQQYVVLAADGASLGYWQTATSAPIGQFHCATQTSVPMHSHPSHAVFHHQHGYHPPQLTQQPAGGGNTVPMLFDPSALMPPQYSQPPPGGGTMVSPYFPQGVPLGSAAALPPPPAGASGVPRFAGY